MKAAQQLRRPSIFMLTLLAIEFLDEFAYGAGEAAWPLIRDDLALNYIEIGVLLGLPLMIGNLIEPVLGILADYWNHPTWKSPRRLMILAGGLLCTLSYLLTALSWGYLPLLASFCLFAPASGAFVNLSQAAMMDAEPQRREKNMARWTFAGSAGVVIGPLALGGAILLGPGWRGMYFLVSGMAMSLWLLTTRLNFVSETSNPTEVSLRQALKAGARGAFQALKRIEVLRWLALLEFSDLMLDVLLGFLALYLVDIVGVSPQQASLAVVVWTGVGLLGDLLLIPLLERISGLAYLRLSAVLELVLYSIFLLSPGWMMKLAALALLGFFNSGWYAILQAQLFSVMPGQSGTALAVKNISGLIASLIPLILGWVAQEYNLLVTMWVLALGPIALLLGLPGQSSNTDHGVYERG